MTSHVLVLVQLAFHAGIPRWKLLEKEEDGREELGPLEFSLVHHDIILIMVRYSKRLRLKYIRCISD